MLFSALCFVYESLYSTHFTDHLVINCCANAITNNILRMVPFSYVLGYYVYSLVVPHPTQFSLHN
jgi:hypothetical protein